MANQCGAFCLLCGRCGRKISEEAKALAPKDVLPPGVRIEKTEPMRTEPSTETEPGAEK